MALNDIIEAKDRIIDIAEANYLKPIPDIQEKLFERLQEYLNSLKISGGKLDTEQNILEAIGRLEATINAELRASGYGANVQEYLRNFDQLNDLNAELQKGVNNITVTAAQINPIRDRMVTETVDIMAGNGLDINLKQPVKDLLRKNIVFGSTISDTETALRELILGDAEKLGKLDRYARQIARDSIQQYDGAVNNQIREVFEMPNITYVGSLITDSRPQCVRWVGKGTIPFNELQEELNWAEANGSGMIPGTTPSNFTVFRGGYNCRHEAIPTF